MESGPAGVGAVAPGRGRKPEIAAAVVEAIVDDTLHSVPEDGSAAWSTRSMAQRHGVGKDTVARVWRARELRPWRTDTFKLSQDRDFEAKLVDVVGLYMDPPERAAVFSFDEKTQVQALDRTQASLPLRPGRARTLTHDYKRNAPWTSSPRSTSPPAEVLHQTPQTPHRPRRAGLLQMDRPAHPQTPRRPRRLDNLSAHKSQPVRDWLAHPKRKRCHLQLHPHIGLMAQPHRGLVLRAHPQGPHQQQLHSTADLTDTIDIWPRTGTTTPSPSPGPKPPTTSSPKSNEDEPALTKTATDH